MGWKAFAILATDTPGYFGTRPAHDPSAAEALRRQLGLERYEHAGETDFYSALYPAGGDLYIGAYENGCILCESDLPTSFFAAEHARRIRRPRTDLDSVRTRLLTLYPQGQVMALVLHSVVNLWGYSIYTQGRLLRTAAGASDDGLFANEGAPLPEEQAVLQRCPLDRVDEEGEGEELVFDVTTRMFGRRLDSIDDIELRLAHYRRASAFGLGAMKRLFGRR